MKLEDGTVITFDEAILKAKTALQNGLLDEYKPLIFSRAEAEQSNSNSSWGPAHKK